MKKILLYAVALVVLWCIPAFVFGLQYVLDDLLSGHPYSLWASMKSGLPRWLIWAPLTPLAIWFARRINRSAKRSVARQIAMHLCVILLLAIPASISWALGPMPGSSRLPVWSYLLILYPVSLVWTAPLYSGIAGLTYAVDARIAATELERLLAEAKLDALHAQLRPHFFFNTLHAIASLIRSNRGSEAVSMIARLGDLVRETLLDGGAAETTLERELELARLYLEIQRVRFSDRLKVEFHAAPELLDAMVPPLLLQPLIENAVDHGIASLEDGGKVMVRAVEVAPDKLSIEVHNTGCLHEGAEGVGLSNTRQRLQHLYGDAQNFKLHSDGENVIVRIEIPCRKSKP